MRGRVRKQVLLPALSLMIGTGLALVAAEALLRVSGRTGWHDLSIAAREPTMHERDTVLGWRAKEGSYEVPAYTPHGEPVRMTFLSDGSRDTGGGERQSRPHLVFVGGSFIQGWGISDEETLAWRTQQRLPAWKVSNFGTAGYGTYQSLLVLERLFSAPEPPDAVIYGLIGHHEHRNVATAVWLRTLAGFSRRGTIAVPYCTLGPGGSLVRHAPEQHPRWPLRRHLATVASLENAHAEFGARGRVEQARPVTTRLLLEMDGLAEDHGATFSVVLLGFPTRAWKNYYVHFLGDHDITFADCAFPLTPAWLVPGENHPNGSMNERWARCIEKSLIPSVVSGGGPAGPTS